MPSISDIVLIAFSVPLFGGRIVDFIGDRKELSKKRKCIDCCHIVKDHPTDEHPKCGRHMQIEKSIDPVTGRERSKVDGTYCSIARGNGTFWAVFLRVIFNKRPQCSRHGWFWKAHARVIDAQTDKRH